MDDTIPEQIREVLTDSEIQNIKDRRGWSKGTAVLYENDEIQRRIDDVYVELLNGEGEAGDFKGVRFMGIGEDGEYEESYAHESRETAFSESEPPFWYIEEYEE